MYEPQSNLGTQIYTPDAVNTYDTGVPMQPVEEVPPPPPIVGGDINVKLCRCCQLTELEEGDEFIAPCKCSGSIKYVHRSCLDKWRAVSPQPESFWRCDICHTPYVFQEKVEKEPGCGPRLKIGLLISLDLVIMFVVWQVLVLICTGIFCLCDWNKGRYNYAPEWAKNFLTDYVCGLLLFFFLMGVLAIILGILKALLMCITYMCDDVKIFDNYTYNTYPYHRSAAWEYLWLWYWPIWFDPHPHHCNIADCCLLPLYCCAACSARDCDCNASDFDCSGVDCDCSPGDCNCSGDCKEVGAVLAVIAIVIIVIIIIVGVLFVSRKFYIS